MFELIADQELCKGCACVSKVPCFIAMSKQKSLLVSRARFEEEEVQEAVKAVIQACPKQAIELRSYGGARVL